MQKARNRRLNKRRKFIKRLMVYTTVGLLGFLMIWHPVNASTTSQGNPATQQNSNGINQIDFINQAFQAVHAKQTGYILHDYNIINQQFTSEKNLSNLGKQLVQELGLKNAKITVISRTDDVFYNVEGEWPDQTNLSLTLSSFKGSSIPSPNASNPIASGNGIQSTGITVLAISGICKETNANVAKQQYQMMVDAVRTIGITPQMSACLEGYLGDKIVGVHEKDIVAKAFRAIQAVPVEGMYSPLETSVSGYSSNNKQTYIQTNGKRMNVQVAVHADSINHRTNVLVGTPIITDTY